MGHWRKEHREEAKEKTDKRRENDGYRRGGMERMEDKRDGDQEMQEIRNRYRDIERCAHTYIHTYTHIYIYIYIYTYTDIPDRDCKSINTQARHQQWDPGAN